MVVTSVFLFVVLRDRQGRGPIVAGAVAGSVPRGRRDVLLRECVEDRARRLVSARLAVAIVIVMTTWATGGGAFCGAAARALELLRGHRRAHR
jgi:hypothetical protein